MSTDEHVLKSKNLPPNGPVDKDSSVPQVVVLDESWLIAICQLEPKCYPNPWSPALIRGEFSKEISLRLGLVKNGELLAYSFCHVFCHQLHVLNFAVAPEHRGRGLATLLMSHVLRYGVREGMQQALLEVRPSNTAALHLYARFGFQRVGVRRRYYRDNGEDAILLERDIELNDVSHFEWVSFSALDNYRKSSSST